VRRCAAAATWTVSVVLLAALWVTSAPPAHAADDDYLSAELRARVEQLKVDCATTPTTPDTIWPRAEVLWEWANAYSMTGGVIPNDLPLLVRLANQIRAGEYVAVAAQVAAYLDFVVRELLVKDEVPGALGTLALHPAGPMEAETWTTVTQTWTVGEVPMVEGGAIYLGRDGFNNSGVPQEEDPDGNNYFTISSSNPDARFSYQGADDGLSLVTAILGIYRLEGVTLNPGDTVTMVYGDRSQGSRGFWIQSYSVSRCTFPVYLDVEGTGNFMQPAWPGVEVVGKPEISRVAAFVPSIVAAGEPFDLTVRSEDNRYNRATGSTPAYEVWLGDTRYPTIPAGSDTLTVFEDFVIATPGVYRFTVRSADGSITGTSNPIWVQEDPSHRIYWGDTHGHVAYADGQGTPDGYFVFARDDARLDFVTLSDHSLWLDDREWQTLQGMVAKYKEEGRFIPILGHEWTVALPQGHHNVYYRNPWADRVGSQIAWRLRSLYDELRRRVDADDVLSIPHAHNPGNWEVSAPSIERLVEITSTHGTFEWFGNRYLEQGWEVGFIGSSDNHHEHPGYTDAGPSGHHQRGGLAAVMAGEKTTDSIFDAMRDRRAYATGGQRIILDASLNGVPMGTRLPYSVDRRLACAASGTAPIDTIDVVKNGDVVYQRRYTSQQLDPHSWVRVGFASSSEVFEYARPRGFRIWQGTIEVQGARLLQVVAPGLENRFYEHATSEDENIVEFFVFTRGRMDAVALELDEVDQDTTLRIRVWSTYYSGFPDVRVPPIRFDLSLADAQAGPVVREFEVVDPSTELPSVDEISVQIFDPSDSLDQEFEFTDLGPAAPGDYYYLRVTQIDGAQAWSSPWWVGGRSPSRVLRASPTRRSP
jgi:hypothetical protein